MPTRTVTGVIARPGTAEASVTFELANPNRVEAGTQPAVVRAALDSLGYFSVALWCQAEGLPPTRYRMRTPTYSALIDLYLPGGIGPIDIASIMEPPSIGPIPPQPGADPYPQYLTRARGDALYALIGNEGGAIDIATHNASVNAHPDIRTLIPNTYTHIQNSLATTWTINHGLGRNPSISVFLSDGSEVFGTRVNNGLNSVSMTFAFAVNGTAYCI